MTMLFYENIVNKYEYSATEFPPAALRFPPAVWTHLYRELIIIKKKLYIVSILGLCFQVGGPR